MTRQKIFFIGGGNMASALIGGLDRTIWDISICEPSEERRNWLKEHFKELSGKLFSSAATYLVDADVVVFAVKPQSVGEVFREVASVDFSGKLVVSIMAGVPLSVLKKELKGKKIGFARTMPNMPMLVGKGETGVFLEEERYRASLDALFCKISRIHFVKEEGDIDKITALSGSGPAYVFAFMEALTQAGIAMGLEVTAVQEMVLGTVLGAATLASQSSCDFATLRKQVTSKGGTTERALSIFAEGGLDKLTEKAVFAAHQRAKELASGFKIV